MTETKINIIDINAQTVDKTGFFCFMSKRKAVGYERKLNWLKNRFAEGLRSKMLKLPERGFIEYLPGEFAWRAVNATGFMFIHCLWVVGKSKGKGFSSVLLEECLREAKESGCKGVAMVTSERIWLMGKKLLVKHGFVSVDELSPFNLMVKKFDKAPDPSFANDWAQKASRHPTGLTVMYSDQCPYVYDATNTVADFAGQRGFQFQAIELESSQEVRELSPSPYGVFSIIFNGQLLSYHYLLPKDLAKIADKNN
jgi:GNAT superfamily N-acetyltransferase